MNVDAETISITLVNATSGLSLGLSSAVLADALPWRWTDRRPWIITALMVLAWIPLELVGSPPARRFTNSGVDIYLCVLFVLYITRRARAREHHARRRQDPGEQENETDPARGEQGPSRPRPGQGYGVITVSGPHR